MTDPSVNDRTDGRPVRRWLPRVGAVVVVAAGGLIALQFGAADERDPPLSYDERAAPGFELPDLANPQETVALDAADAAVVLNIWASWCVPCRREMPVLQAAHSKFGDQVAFIGINHLDQRNEALDFLAEVGVTYPSGYDPDGSVARSFGAFGLPTTYFITESGRIIATKTGELTQEELSSEIDRLLQAPE